MSKKKNKSLELTPSDVVLYIFRILVSAYCCVFFISMPLFYHNKYYDIGDFKYKMFMYLTVSFLLFAFIMLAVYLFIQLKGGKINLQSAKELVLSMSVIDWFVLAFGIISILSFIFSPVRTSEFPTFFLFKNSEDTSIVNLPWEGYTGWNMGLRSQLMFVAMYFFVSRLFMKSWQKDFLYIMLGSASIAFILGILHRFGIDPLGLYENLDDYYRLTFLSTLGQSSWYSSFMILIIPIGMAFFMFSDNNISFANILLSCFVAVSGATFVTQNSDSAYMAFLFIILVMFAVSFRNNELFLKFWEMMIIMLGSMKIIGILQILLPNSATVLDSLSFFISKSVLTWLLLAAVIAFYVFIRFRMKDRKFSISKYTKIRNVLIILVIACIPLGVLVVYLNTKGLLPTTALDGIEYFTFNDRWGNNRGFVWKNTIEIMSEPTWRSLAVLGIGPDCFATVAYASEPRASEMIDYCAGAIIVCVHNEWLNMLFNEGILGFISYLGIFVSSFVLFMRKAASPVMTACAASTAAYFFHNMFCYQQILCTPMIFCIIALGVWYMRENEL